MRKRIYSWKNENDSVRRFLEYAAKEYSISDLSGWYRVSNQQIRKTGGGALLIKYGNLANALKFVYPDYPWELSKFQLRSKKSAQRWLLLNIRQLLPEGTLFHEDYKLELTEGEITKKVEADIWIPSLKLVLEYQGEYHSLSIPGSGFSPPDKVQHRDSVKQMLCKNNGLIYVAIGYWWDGKKDSLCSTLHQYLPDIFPKTDSPPIPFTLPYDYKIRDESAKRELKMPRPLMEGLDYDINDPNLESPEGWFMTEKYDGIRGYWDGKQFWSKRGNLINVPDSFKEGLPNYHLDGEFWGGYEDNVEITTLLKLNCGKKKTVQLDWNKVKFCVFDAPQEVGFYDKRHLFLQKNFPYYNNNHIRLIPMEKCKGRTHLNDSLDEIIKRGGEGIMIYRPDILHQPGRSGNVLKVKKYFDDEVKFLRVDEKSYTLICEQPNGHKISVRTRRVYCFESPTPGTKIPIIHQGFFAHSQKYKYPVMNTTAYENSIAQEKSNNIEISRKETKTNINNE